MLGGPGGSGVDMVIRSGKSLQNIISTSDNIANSTTEGLYFDIIGFDPRGINNTTPNVECFPDAVSREIWKQQSSAEGIITDDHSFRFAWSRSKAVGATCSQVLKENDGVGRFVNTGVVAQDMVAIIDALGQWRANERGTIHPPLNTDSAQSKIISQHAQTQAGKEKLLYWGISYGSLLGATFAAMYPERVGRVVLDGVVDAEDYYAGVWGRNLQDADKVMDQFFEQCHAAGPKDCELFSIDGSEGSRRIFNKVMKDLEAAPLPVPETGNYGPDIVTYSDVREYIRNTMYNPQRYFKNLARLIVALSKGNGTELASRKQSQIGNTCRSPACKASPRSRHHGPQPGATTWRPFTVSLPRTSLGTTRRRVRHRNLSPMRRSSRNLTAMRWFVQPGFSSISVTEPTARPS